MKKILVLVPLLLVVHSAFSAEERVLINPDGLITRMALNADAFDRSWFAQAGYSMGKTVSQQFADIEKSFATMSKQVVADGKEIRAKAKAGVPGYVYRNSTMDASGKRTIIEEYGSKRLKLAGKEMSSTDKAIAYTCASLALAGLGYLAYQILIG